MVKYVDQKTFNDLCKNQRKLIDVLNHRMTKMEVNVQWLKRLSQVSTGLLTAILITLLGKILLGV